MNKFKSLIVATVAAVGALSASNAMAASEQAIAKQLADKLQNSANVNATVRQVANSQIPLLVNNLMPEIQNQRYIGAGTTKNTEVWLHMPETRALADDMSDLVVAFPPAGDENEWTEVIGYNLKGGTVTMDVNNAPNFPVLVVEDHGYHALKDGIAQINSLLQAKGLQKGNSTERFDEYTPSAGFDAKKLTRIKLNDDQEPWIKGAAEIYSLVTGVLPGNEPQIIAVDMPYLDHDGTTYYPNQLVINWSNYNYQVVDMLYYEADGNTNYKELVQALITAVGAVGSLAGWPPAVALAEITNRVIDATPSSWYTDDDDFVDACYTLEKGKTYSGFRCAGANATISMEPFYVQSNLK